MNNADVSIIIPVFNREDYISRCIESVINQNKVSTEVIVVDDGSEDNTLEICNTIARKNPNVHVVHQDNRGLASARNVGLDIASGDFITFLDSDDYLPQDALAYMVDVINKKTVDMVIGSYDVVTDEGNILERKAIPSEFMENSFGRNEFWRLNSSKIYNMMFTVVWGKLYRKGVWKKIRFGTGVRFAEDEFVLPELIDNCKSFCCLDHCVYIQTSLLGSLSRSTFNYHKLNSPESKLITCEYLIRKGLYAYAVEKWGIAVGEILLMTKLSKDLDAKNKLNVLQRKSILLGKILFEYMNINKKIKYIGYIFSYPFYTLLHNIIHT